MSRITAAVIKAKRSLNRLSCVTPKTNCRGISSPSALKNVTVEVKSHPSSVASRLPPRLSEPKRQNYDYFLVADFEATCDAPVTLVPQEIIEFPVLKINGKTFETESVFHSYVQPKIHKELTPFCTELTGIIQEMVDNEPYFEEVFQNFLVWMEKESLLKPGVKFVFVTCGDWDLRYIFQMQCKGCRIPVPPFMKSWINIKLCFSELAQTWPRNLVTMLKLCGLQHEGRLHSGVDDCKNIAQVLKDLAYRGFVFECNSRSN